MAKTPQEQTMRELAGTVSNPSLQGKIRKVMSHTRSFRVEDDLPADLRAKLDELDRASRKN